MLAGTHLRVRQGARGLSLSQDGCRAQPGGDSSGENCRIPCVIVLRLHQCVFRNADKLLWSVPVARCVCRRWRVTAVQLDPERYSAGCARRAGGLAPDVGQLSMLQALELPSLGCAPDPHASQSSVAARLAYTTWRRAAGQAAGAQAARVSGVCHQVIDDTHVRVLVRCSKRGYLSVFISSMDSTNIKDIMIAAFATHFHPAYTICLGFSAAWL